MKQTNDQVHPATATPEDTLLALLQLNPRGYTQLRHVLVQLPKGTQGSRSSTLSRLLTGRKHRALMLYLMLMTCWPWLKDRKSPLEGAVWVRALTSDDSGALTWSPSTLSQAWSQLEDLNLITRQREGRLARVTPRREDAEGAYEAPAGESNPVDRYFVLPDDFWRTGLFAKLSFPGLVVLLVFLKETNGKEKVHLTYDNFNDWYGISQKSAQKGIEDLENLKLLTRDEQVVPAPLSGIGRTTKRWYTLTGAYATGEREKRRKAAAKAAAAKGTQGPQTANP